METPLATRRITRSLAAASAHKSAAAADPSSCRSKNGEQQPLPPPRAALHDITNDSPIVGLAVGGLGHDGTPRASAAGKTRPRPRPTPGSGEALLRGQVKTLLQKVDEEVIRPVRIHALLGVSRSPAQLLAPTPANTPQLGVESAAARGESLLSDGIKMAMPCVLEEEEPLHKLQVIDAPPNRALVFDDSPEKSDPCTEESVASSSLTFHAPDDDSSSVWSIQVNVSSDKDESEFGHQATMGELEEYYTEEELEEEYYTEEEEDWQEEDDDDDDDECFDELCEGVSKMTVLDGEEEKKKKVGLPAFEGRHTRFVYNSDDEIVERKDVENAAAEHGALLRGLPVPEGKHLRFQDDDEEE